MPDVIYLGPSDNLLLKEGGKEYHPGDTIRMSAEALGNLTRAGMRFAHAHSEEEAAAIQAQLNPPLYEAPVELATAPPPIEHAPASAVVPQPEPTHARPRDTKEST